MTRNPNEAAERARALELTAMSEEVLADLGIGTLAYVRKVQAQEMETLFPEVPPLQNNVTLWALLNADGTPILLADSREAAVANAFEHDLEMVSLH